MVTNRNYGFSLRAYDPPTGHHHPAPTAQENSQSGIRDTLLNSNINMMRKARMGDTHLVSNDGVYGCDMSGDMIPREIWLNTHFTGGDGSLSRYAKYIYDSKGNIKGGFVSFDSFKE